MKLLPRQKLITQPTHFNLLGRLAALTLLSWFIVPGTRAGTVPDAFIPGSVSVVIEPAEAVADGAQWSVDGRPSRPSGTREENLVPGPHTIVFTDLAAWIEPKGFEVVVVGGGETQLRASLARLPTYYFKAVPEQSAPHGSRLEFVIRTEDPDDPQSPGPGAPVQISTAPPPAGPISVDPISGRFSYTPAVADRLPFNLTLTVGGQQATTLISPRPNLPPEESVLSYNRSLPDEESEDYIQISESRNAPEPFNNSQQPIETLNVSISGKVLVFEAGHPSRLLPIYNERINLKEMNLYAEKVIVRSPIHWPQTHVTIHARELRFEADGKIDTTPANRTRRPEGAVYGDGLTQGRPGEGGIPGGNIDVFIERFFAEPGPARFIMRGGKGGPAGEGRNGQTNEDLLRDESNNLLYPMESSAWSSLMQRRGVRICDVTLVFGRMTAITLMTKLDTDTFDFVTLCGSTNAPKGENAIRSGRPGTGGTGGNLQSPLDLSSFAVFEGGPSGQKGNDYVGGTLSGPFARSHKQLIDGKLRTAFSSIAGQPGNPATAPGPVKAVGDSGTYIPESNPGAWLHSFALRSILQFAKDAYLNGHVSEARAVLAEYRDLIRAIYPEAPVESELSDEEFAEQLNVSQILLEMEVLIHRIDSNLDYFGNPAGFVPMLSFEVNLEAFRTEVDQSIPILYLAHWLGHTATNLQNSIAASQTARSKLGEELGTMEADFNEAQESIPQLKSIAEDLKIKIAQTQARLATLESRLKARAQQNIEDKHKLPVWKQALGVLSVAAHLIPVGQPTVGRIGSGLELIGQLDGDDPLGSAATVAPKAIEAFSEKDISACFKDGSVTNETDKARSARLSACGKVLGGQLTELAGVFKDAQVDKSELEAELARIKSLDPDFKAITEELAELNKQKEEFGVQLASALQAIAALTSAMNENLAASLSLEDQIGNNLAVLNHNALLHIKEMEQRTRDRLLKHQYFLAQAFQYRTLKAFPGTFQLNDLFARFQELVNTNQNHILTLEQFDALKNVYTEAIRQITDETRDNFNAPELTGSIEFELTGEELAALNQTGRLAIDLKDRLHFDDTDENVRISDIRTTQIEVQPTGPIGTLATMSLKFRHSGISRLTTKGKTFVFRHYATEENNPIVWKTTYHGLNDTFQNNGLSPAEASLLRELLGSDATTEDLLLFSRPAAFAGIEVTRDVLTDNGTDLVVTRMQVTVDYEADTEGVTRPELAIKVNGGLQPLIAVSQPDINGRQDGLGSFSRVYQPFTQLTLEAPATFGGVEFDHWIVNGLEMPEGLTFVALRLEQADKLAEAIYKIDTSTIVPPQFLTQPQDLVATENTSASFSAIVTGTEPMSLRWHKDGVPLVDGARISGAATANLSLSGLESADNGGYSLVVSNAAGVATSQVALLAVTTTTLTTLAAGPGNVGFEFQTATGFRYSIERAVNMLDPQWTVVEVLDGTGAPLQFTRPTADAPTAFFRLRVEPVSGP